MLCDCRKTLLLHPNPSPLQQRRGITLGSAEEISEGAGAFRPLNLSHQESGASAPKNSQRFRRGCPSHCRGARHAAVKPPPKKYFLTLSFRIASRHPHFAGNFPLSAHNGNQHRETCSSPVAWVAVEPLLTVHSFTCSLSTFH